MKEKKRSRIKKAAVTVALPGAIIVVCVLIAGMMIGANISESIEPITPTVEKRSMKPVKLKWLGEVEPGLNVSGVREIYIYPHSNTPASTYGVNLTNTSGYAYGDVNDTHIGSDVPYATTFDIVALVQWNYTHAFNETSGFYDMDFVRGYTNSTVLSISANNMTEYQVWNRTEEMYVHHVDDNSGSGYTINRGQNVTSCYFDFEAYYV